MAVCRAIYSIIIFVNYLILILIRTTIMHQPVPIYTIGARLRELEMNKEEADRKRLEINKQKDEYEALDKRSKQIEIDMGPVKDEFNRLKKIDEQLSSISSEKEKAKNE